MKIISIISSPKGGGAELLVRELHKINLGLKIDMCTVYLNGSADGLEQGEIVFGVNPRNPMNIFRIRKLLKHFLATTNDVLTVHVHLTWPFYYVAIASVGLRKLKLIYTEHSTTNRRRRIPLLSWFERLLYARYACVICISNGVYRSLGRWVGPKLQQRLVIIPNGSRIYALAARPELKGRLPRLISVGSLTFKKNFATAIHAVGQIRDEIERYIIIGEGPDRGRLEQLIRTEKLENKVELVGWSDEIEKHLHAADIQLIPSLWEGFGLVAVEGMSTGLSVVASNVEGLREVLSGANLAVTLINQTESVDEWAAGVREAIASLREFEVDRIALSARQQAERFTLDKMADQYLSVYRQC